MYMICARSIRVTKDELRFTFIFYIRTWSFFVKLVNVKKYITFLSKVRSSRHVMLSKIATPLSAQCLVWQASRRWQHRHEQRSALCRGLNCSWKHAGARERRTAVPSGYGTGSTPAHWAPFRKIGKHLKQGHSHCGRSIYHVCRPSTHA